MSRKISPLLSKDDGFSWWWLGLKVGVVTALILWWWLENRNKKRFKETVGEEPSDDTPSIPLPVEKASLEEKPVEVSGVSEIAKPAVQTPAEPDDLTKIEGIGPKISKALRKAGISTFAQLAAYSPEVIKQFLNEAGIRIGHPDTWPEQAALAAKEDWKALEKLQNELKGGRRVE
jgi:predicted flap endonuclease-1-like 5' DNA nuclease